MGVRRDFTADRGAVIDDLAQASFENTFVRDLPADPVLVNIPRQVSNACYTRVEPTAVAAPRLLGWSSALGESLGLSRPGPLAVEVLGGNRVLPGMQPYAARYGGHQFGPWAGQLGDGPPIAPAPIIARDGSRQELPLKGAGKNPYSPTPHAPAVLPSPPR